MIAEIQKFLQQETDLFGDELAIDLANIQTPTIKQPTLQAKRSESRSTLESLQDKAGNCTVCGDSVFRKKLVFDAGSVNADIAIIGHFPSDSDNEIGNPFSGDVGELLDKMLSAIQLSREQIYFCNLLKCKPLTSKIGPQAKACRHFMIQQLEIVKPKVILCMGEIVGQSLLKKRASLEELRLQNHEYNQARVFVTYHPANLLTNSQLKKPAWVDLQKFKEYYSQLEM